MQKLSSTEQRQVHRQRQKQAKVIAAAISNHYDSAQTTPENERHWAHARLDSIHDLTNAHTRRTLAARSRYEFRNNGICRGVITRLSADTVMSGPTLQMHGSDNDLNTRIESDFDWHARHTNLARHLRTTLTGEINDGETFPTIVQNDEIGMEYPNGVSIDLEIRDFTEIDNDNSDDRKNIFEGIQYDANGRPVAYLFESGPVAADLVCHFFRPDMPRQRRGVTRIASALPLYSQLRRFTLATLAAAESAASLGGLLKTDLDSSEFDEEDENGESVGLVSADDILENMDMERFGFMTVPKDWDLTQFESKHPNSQMEPFRKAIISEAARCLNIPYNVAAADSSKHNYASSRLDLQQYQSTLTIEQEFLERLILDRYLKQYLREWALINGIPLAVVEKLRWSWYWAKIPHVDPTKVASANEKNLAMGAVSLAELLSDQGKDIDKELPKEAAQYGVTPEQFKKMLLIKRFGIQAYTAIMGQTTAI